jgi:hypothetical protein
MWSGITASSRPTVDTSTHMPRNAVPQSCFPLSVHPRQVHRTLPSDEPPIPCDPAYLGRNRDPHRHLIGQAMSFFDPTLFLLRQLAQHFPQVPAQFFVQHFPPAPRDKPHNLHSHWVWLRPSISSIANSLSCAWRLTSGSLRDGLRYLSNFYSLPGRAGGLPFVLDQEFSPADELCRPAEEDLALPAHDLIPSRSVHHHR